MKKEGMPVDITTQVNETARIIVVLAYNSPSVSLIISKMNA